MASLFTTAGLALMAQRRQTEDPVVIDRVQIGSLTPAQRYEATVGQAALVDSSLLSRSWAAGSPGRRCRRRCSTMLR